jgi:hypothetical protein
VVEAAQYGLPRIMPMQTGGGVFCGGRTGSG